MKQLIVILAFLPFLTNGQSFKLTDSIFKVESIYRTYQIKFDLAKTNIKPESNLFLDSIVDFLLKNENLIVEIGVHSDSRWSDTYGTLLYMNRAMKISEYLISKGVNNKRLISKGYNSAIPLISDDEIKKLTTKEEIEKAHQKNRRVEFKIMEIKNSEDEILDFYVVETKPEFPGGESEMMKYIMNNLKIKDNIVPNDCIFSKFYISFIIDTTGKAINPNVSVNDCPLNENYKKEIFNFIENMPKWTPGESRGKKVKVKFSMPIHIHLND